MFRPEHHVTENVFAILLGTSEVKWDVVWNYVHWLASPGQGHGLGTRFRDRLTAHAFGEPLSDAETRQEFRIEHGKSGKWPDLAVGAPNLDQPESLLFMDDLSHRRAGDSRKIGNLELYLDGAQAIVGRQGGRARVSVLTDTTDLSRFKRLKERLPGMDPERTASSGWRLLPLPTVGRWVGECSDEGQDATRANLVAFSRWACSFQ